MEETYEDILLKYLTGNLKKEEGTYEPIFNEQVEEIQENIKDNITNKLEIKEEATYVTLLGSLYNNAYSNFIIYGFYENSSGYFGYIYIVDEKLNEISLITEFDSGTKLFPITALNQDEDNYFYALSYELDSETPNSRVLLLNNILSSGLMNKEYKVVLRNSYIIPNSSTNYRQNPYRQNRIIKSQEEAVYYITMHNTSSQTVLIKFKINVGSTNEWNVYNLGCFIDSVQFANVIDKSSGEEIIKYYGIDIIDDPGIYYEIQVANEKVSKDKQINLGVSVNFLYSQVFVKNINEIYLSILDSSNAQLIVYKINGNNLQKIYTLPLIQISDGYYNGYIKLLLVNNTIFCKIKYGITETSTIVAVGIIQDDIFYSYETGISAQEFGIYDYADFFIMSQYNLINIFAPLYGDVHSTKKITMDYNTNNYNGMAYENTNSLFPKKGRLYDENNKMVFARNLYNKSINDNVTMSTINIPNTLLNNVKIASKCLLGETNYTLINNNDIKEKNIYENLNINFQTTLRMINNNDKSNPIFNFEGSTRLNESVSNIIDYNNVKATKLRINYSDGTFTYQQLFDSQITINNKICTYKFTVYSPAKAILNIEIISQDETTVYQTIESNFKSNKYYEIIQKVIIEEEMI